MDGQQDSQKRVLKPDRIIGDGVELAQPKQIGEKSPLLDRLQQAKGRNERDSIIEQVIASGETKTMVNAISRVADYPNGCRRLVEAIVENQKREQSAHALVFLIKNSEVVQRAPKLKYIVVKAIIEGGNQKALEEIAALSTVQEVPLLVKALKARDTAGITVALERFDSPRS